MLKITIPETDLFNEETNEFTPVKEQTLVLEHSLVSISKWESKWCRPFFEKKEKTHEETIDYIRCMTITQHVKPEVYLCITKDIEAEVMKYIEAPMTATTFSDRKQGGSGRERITSELIYYWMITFKIPVEFEKWHLNRLLTLIRVCEVKNTPPKKMSKGEIMNRNRALNAARRQQLNTKG